MADLGRESVILKIVEHRVDALVMAFRTRLSKETLQTVKARAGVAYAHGRAALQVADLDWEIRYSRTPKRWNLTRFDHVRAMIDLCAPGAVLSYEGGHSHIVETGDQMIVPDMNGTLRTVEGYEIFDAAQCTEEPGWTLELVYYAQYLAEHPIDAVIEESRELAGKFGRVFEERVRRVDLAADIAGFRVKERDRHKLITRSALRLDPKRAAEVQVYQKGDDLGTAVMHAKRVITGLTIGKGPLMCRMYDKQEELRVRINDETNQVEREKLQAKAVREVDRWLKNGWNGKDPITRVEFQLRGEPLREMGVRRGDNIIEPLVAQLPGLKDGATGELYTLGGYIPRIWSYCLAWTRLGIPTKSKDGAMLQRTRWRLDPRWKILHRVDWARRCHVHTGEKCSCVPMQSHASDKIPIKRVRTRAPVSSAQAVGAMASLVAARGELPEHDESIESYKEGAHEKLLAMLRALCTWGVDHIAADLISRWGSSDQAAVHLAIRLNAARARFALARASPTETEEKEETWLPSGQLESGKHEVFPSMPSGTTEKNVTPGERAATQTILRLGWS